ncbi:hypothetical protein AVEN_143758-1 [Araneus ventricosus]|uniref:Uncharacterized protein n=1 Tax=Araneus ventricosus TaxID=182803 RepID=A0A4Y2AP41_ARAVE|nr:hypothetical protein AVEN_143758-1 [Araneus ventricosus]
MRNPDDKLTDYSTTERVNWKLGVKSFKYQLKRSVSSIKLTIEEFLTFIPEIDGMLNSRPNVPSADPDDYTAFSRPITSTAEPQLIEKSDNYS